MKSMLGICDVDSILYRACWDVLDLNEAKEKYLDILQGYLADGWCDDAVCFAKGVGNWRLDIFDKYKAHRMPDPKRAKERQIVLDLLVWLREEKLAILSDGMEADDLVRRKAIKCMQRNQPYTIVSADKDLDCIEGNHIRPSRGGVLNVYEISPEEADYNYYMQVLVGDPTDNIKSPPKLGPKTAEKILNQNPRGQWKKAIETAYRDRCGRDWYHALMFTGSLIHIQRYPHDYFVWNKEDGNFWECGFSGPPKCYDYK